MAFPFSDDQVGLQSGDHLEAERIAGLDSLVQQLVTLEAL